MLIESTQHSYPLIFSQTFLASLMCVKFHAPSFPPKSLIWRHAEVRCLLICGFTSSNCPMGKYNLSNHIRISRGISDLMNMIRPGLILGKTNFMDAMLSSIVLQLPIILQSSMTHQITSEFHEESISDLINMIWSCLLLRKTDFSQIVCKYFTLLSMYICAVQKAYKTVTDWT